MYLITLNVAQAFDNSTVSSHDVKFTVVQVLYSMLWK